MLQNWKTSFPNLTASQHLRFHILLRHRYLMHSSGKIVPFTFFLLWCKAACCVTTCVLGCYLWGILCNTHGAHSVSLAAKVGREESRSIQAFFLTLPLMSVVKQKKKSKRGRKAILLCKGICKAIILVCFVVGWFGFGFLFHCPLFKIEILSVLFAFPGNRYVKTEYQIKKKKCSFAGMKELKLFFFLSETTTENFCIL